MWCHETMIFLPLCALNVFFFSMIQILYADTWHSEGRTHGNQETFCRLTCCMSSSCGSKVASLLHAARASSGDTERGRTAEVEPPWEGVVATWWEERSCAWCLKEIHRQHAAPINAAISDEHTTVRVRFPGTEWAAAGCCRRDSGFKVHSGVYNAGLHNKMKVVAPYTHRTYSIYR